MRGLLAYDDIFYTLKSPSPIVTTSGTDTGSNVVSLRQENWHCYWQSSATSGIWIIMDLRAAYTVKVFGLIGQNCYSQGVSSALLQCGTTDNGSTWDLTVGTIPFLGNSHFEPHACDLLAWSFTKRYWRIWFTGSGISALRIGRIFLGQDSLEFGQTPDSPYEQTPLGQMAAAKTEGGRSRRVKRGSVYERTGISWKSLSASEVSGLEDVREAQGGSEHPLLFVDHNTADSDPYAARYVSLLSLDPTEISPADRFRTRLVLEDKP